MSRKRPQWGAWFAILACLYVLLGIAGGGRLAGVTADSLPPSASAVERSAAREHLVGETIVRSLFLPVRLFVAWSAFSLLLMYACRIWTARERERYAHFLAAEVRAETVLFLGNAAATIAASVGEAVRGPSPAWIPGGLDLFFPAGDFTLRYALNSVNIFSASYVAVLVFTLSPVIGVSRRKTLMSVLLAWVLNLMVTAGIVHSLIREFSFGT